MHLNLLVILKFSYLHCINIVSFEWFLYCNFSTILLTIYFLGKKNFDLLPLRLVHAAPSIRPSIEPITKLEQVRSRSNRTHTFLACKRGTFPRRRLFVPKVGSNSNLIQSSFLFLLGRHNNRREKNNNNWIEKNEVGNDADKVVYFEWHECWIVLRCIKCRQCLPYTIYAILFTWTQHIRVRCYSLDCSDPFVFVAGAPIAAVCCRYFYLFFIFFSFFISLTDFGCPSLFSSIHL